MIKHTLLLALLLGTLTTWSQKDVKKINASVKQSEFEAHLYFIASDEMRGRNTGTIENQIAARYIADRFRAYGVKMAPGAESYFQQVALMKEQRPEEATITIGERTFKLGEDVVFYTSANAEIKTQLVYANYAMEDDLKGLDVKGKIVVAKSGTGAPNERLTPATMKKSALVKEAGALALIELYKPSRYPWKMIQYYFSGEKYALYEGEKDAGFPSAWVNDTNDLLAYFKEYDGKEGTISIKGQSRNVINVPNVIGYIEGTDPVLKNEVIMISAHLDHVGVSKVEGDSIWNGARDNGIGISNMLTAAEYLAKNPPKRSIAFLACNAEEKGLLGSKWYAKYPVIPLNKTVYNLNTDTGGYNDTSLVTVVGFNRTSMTPIFTQAAKAFGLTAIDDMLPEENFYDRSDQVSFAEKGVPAVSYDPGYTSMSEEITKYYHQPGDEAWTLDYSYLVKYSKSFIYSLVLLGNTTEPFLWAPGDKYEPAGKALYGSK